MVNERNSRYSGYADIQTFDLLRGDVVRVNEAQQGRHGRMRQRTRRERLDGYSRRKERPGLRQVHRGGIVAASAGGMKESVWRFENHVAGRPAQHGQVCRDDAGLGGAARVKGVGHGPGSFPRQPADSASSDTERPGARWRRRRQGALRQRPRLRMYHRSRWSENHPRNDAALSLRRSCTPPRPRRGRRASARAQTSSCFGHLPMPPKDRARWDV